MNILDALRNSGKVINEGLINPNKFNAPAANRFKDSALGLASAVPGLGLPVAGLQVADYLNRGEQGNAALTGAASMLPLGAATVQGLRQIAKGARPALTGPGKYMQGSITKGGDKDLFLTHTTPPEGILDTNSFDDPSLAVSRLEQPFSLGRGATDIQLYLDPRKFDPASNPNSKLFNTDVYAYRTDDLDGAKEYIKQLRNNPKFTEHFPLPSYPTTYGRAASIIASPQFKSFDEFQKSPYGAGVLVDKRTQGKDYTDWNNALVRELHHEYGHNNYDFADTSLAEEPELLDMLQGLINAPKNKHLAEIARQQPQDYAELKYTAGMPLDMSHIIGATATGSAPPAVAREALAKLRDKGIFTFDNPAEARAGVNKILGY